MTKTNDFLNKYNYKNYQVTVKGQVPYSEIMLSKLAIVTALYESLDLDEDDICNLNLIPSKTIKLVDGEELTKLMIKHNLGVQVKTTIEIKKIDEDFFSEE